MRQMWVLFASRGVHAKLLHDSWCDVHAGELLEPPAHVRTLRDARRQNAAMLPPCASPFATASSPTFPSWPPASRCGLRSPIGPHGRTPNSASAPLIAEDRAGRVREQGLYRSSAIRNWLRACLDLRSGRSAAATRRLMPPTRSNLPATIDDCLTREVHLRHADA
jgi:hypothetical protein